MEGKKKFEKPEMKVVELKQTGMICQSCTGDYEPCIGYENPCRCDDRDDE